MGQRVLVTGGTGFIGSHLIQYLAQQGHDVLAVVRATSRRDWLERQGIESRVVEFLDPDSWLQVLDGVQTVYHLAGATSGAEAELSRANCDIARALAEACSRCPRPPTLVHVSSLAASGPSTSDRPRFSSDRPQPVSAYGRSKLAGELAVLEFASKLPITILRPVLVFGPREAEISRLYPLIRSGIHPVAGYHKPLLTFLHVEDLITALVHASQYGSRCVGPHPESAEGRGIYYVGDPRHITFQQFADYFHEGLSGKLLLHVPIPLTILFSAAWVTEAVARVINRKTLFNRDKIREGSARAWVCDVATAMQDLKWTPSVPIDERVRQEARRWQSNEPAW